MAFNQLLYIEVHSIANAAPFLLLSTFSTPNQKRDKISQFNHQILLPLLLNNHQRCLPLLLNNSWRCPPLLWILSTGNAWRCPLRPPRPADNISTQHSDIRIQLPAVRAGVKPAVGTFVFPSIIDLFSDDNVLANQDESLASIRARGLPTVGGSVSARAYGCESAEVAPSSLPTPSSATAGDDGQLSGAAMPPSDPAAAHLHHPTRVSSSILFSSFPNVSGILRHWG